MKCYEGHVYDVDERTFAQFFDIIRPLVQNSSKLDGLSRGFPSPRFITGPQYQKKEDVTQLPPPVSLPG